MDSGLWEGTLKAPLPLHLESETTDGQEGADFSFSPQLHWAGEEGAWSQEMRNELSNPSAPSSWALWGLLGSEVS